MLEASITFLKVTMIKFLDSSHYIVQDIQLIQDKFVYILSWY